MRCQVSSEIRFHRGPVQIIAQPMFVSILLRKLNEHHKKSIENDQKRWKTHQNIEILIENAIKRP